MRNASILKIGFNTSKIDNIISRIVFCKQVNYQDVFLFNEKQAKFKMITFGMSTSLLVLRD